MDHSDTDRLTLLDRLADRVPELDSNPNDVEMDDARRRPRGAARKGGGIDGGSGAYVATAGEGLHAVGSLDPRSPAMSAAS